MARDYNVMRHGSIYPWIRFAALLATLGLPTRSLAGEASPQPLRFLYEGAPGCPGASEVAAAVRARGRTIAAGSPPDLRLTVVADGDGFVGSLRLLRDIDRARQVRGSTCREVVDALAVVTVVALGPEAPAGPPDAVESATPAGEPPSTRVTQPPRELRVEAGTLRFERDLTLSLRAGLMSGLLRGTPLPRYDLVVGVENVLVSPDGHQYQLGPLVRVRATLLGQATLHTSHGATHAAGYAVGLELCAPLHYDRAALMWLLCPHFSGGQLQLRTENGAGIDTQTKNAGFGTGGVSFELAYRFGQHVRIEATSGADFVIGEVTAEASDGTQLSKSSLWSVHAMVGVGVTF